MCPRVVLEIVTKKGGHTNRYFQPMAKDPMQRILGQERCTYYGRPQGPGRRAWGKALGCWGPPGPLQVPFQGSRVCVCASSFASTPHFTFGHMCSFIHDTYGTSMY